MPKVWLPRCSALAISIFFPWFPIVPPVVPEAEQTAVATPVAEESVVLPGVVIEEIPKGSALEKAGLQVGDVILSWERLPNPPANPEGVSGRIESPFDWTWLEIEQPSRGKVILLYTRNHHLRYAYLSGGGWNASVIPSLSGSYGRRLSDLRSRLKDAKGEIAFARAKEDLEPLKDVVSPEIISSQFLALGDLYAQFSRWEDAISAYQEALACLDGRLYRALVLSSYASLFRSRNMASEAINLSAQAMEHYRAIGAHILLARELQRLARLYVASNEYPKARAALDEAVEVLEVNCCSNSLVQAAVLSSRGTLRRELRDFLGARSDYEAALQISRRLAPCGNHEASVLLGLGNTLYIQGDFGRAEKIYREVLAIREMTTPRNLNMASILSSLANIHNKRGESEESLSLNEHALRLRLALAPDSPVVADSLNSIGLDYKDLGDMWSAEYYLGEALRIRSNLIPGSLAEAETVSNLGLIALRREEFDRAIFLFTQAYNLLQPLPQGKLALAGVLGNIGTAYFHLGEVINAEQFLEKSLETLKMISASDFEVATVLLNLGDVAYERDDFELAGERYREAARLFAGLGQNSHEVGICLASLAAVAQRMHRLDEASVLYKESLSIEEELAPHGRDLSKILTSIGLISLEEGRLSEAESFVERALLIERKNGRNLGVASALISLGEVAMGMQNYSRALGHYSEALRILNENKGEFRARAEVLFNLGWLYKEIGDYDRARSFLLDAQKTSSEWAPDTWFEAEIEYTLGGIADGLGETELAREAFSNAVLAIEKQVTRIDLQPSNRRSFHAKYREFYGSLLESLILTGGLREAFSVSERGRGRSFLETLSMRRLEIEGSGFSGVGRPDLRAIEARNMHISEALSESRAQAQAGSRRRNVEELLKLRQDYDEALRELSQSSPIVTALREPKFLDVDAAVSSLEPTTVLLSYWVSDGRTFLFVLSRDGALRVHVVSIDQSSLREKIWRMRSLVSAAAYETAASELRSSEVKRLGRELYRLLVSPAEGQIETAERMLIVPDGPLHYLPFGALVREVPEGDGRLRAQYLAEWKPFHSVLSATLYAEIKEDRRLDIKGAKEDALNLVAFGAPQYPVGMSDKETESISDLRVRSAMRHDAISFKPLYFSRREVEGIAALFPPEKAQIYVGVNASEERVKAVGKGTRILHFATHARLDDRLPLDSALVLTMPEGFPPDRDNGLLQVWEIFEKVRIDADLVVLSACETALGEEQGGEGLIGLTRAFQYAGARTVMASLWSVQDQATSELMIRFYKHLRAGLPKDEALRQAQIELIRGPIEVVNEKGEKTLLDASSPYFWAGFQLYGDWQ